MSRRSSVRIGGTIGSGGRAARLLGSEVRVLLPEVRCEVAYDLSTHAASAKLNLYKRQVRQHYRGIANRAGKLWSGGWDGRMHIWQASRRSKCLKCNRLGPPFGLA